nr:DUF4383 domain-containing protein [Angustibacter aerolatus]
MVDPVHTPTDLEPAPVRTVARLVGVVFLVVGVLGFVPGVTSDFSRMEMAGDPSHAMLLGIFRVSVLHNVLHLLFGVAGLVLSSHASGARWYLVGGGLAYLGLAVYGQAHLQRGAVQRPAGQPRRQPPAPRPGGRHDRPRRRAARPARTTRLRPHAVAARLLDPPRSRCSAVAVSDPQIEPAPHDWHVEQREIDRQVSRRGRVHAYEQARPRPDGARRDRHGAVLRRRRRHPVRARHRAERATAGRGRARRRCARRLGGARVRRPDRRRRRVPRGGGGRGARAQRRRRRAPRAGVGRVRRPRRRPGGREDRDERVLPRTLAAARPAAGARRRHGGRRGHGHERVLRVVGARREHPRLPRGARRRRERRPPRPGPRRDAARRVPHLRRHQVDGRRPRAAARDGQARRAPREVGEGTVPWACSLVGGCASHRERAARAPSTTTKTVVAAVVSAVMS